MSYIKNNLKITKSTFCIIIILILCAISIIIYRSIKNTYQYIEGQKNFTITLKNNKTCEISSNVKEETLTSKKCSWQRAKDIYALTVLFENNEEETLKCIKIDENSIICPYPLTEETTTYNLKKK